MAWDTTDVAAVDVTAYTAGKPYLAAQNLLRGATHDPVWSESGTWSDSDTGETNNRDDASYPTRYLRNDQLYDYSQASTAANTLTTLYLLIDVSPNNGSTYDKVFDTVFIYVLNGSSFTNLSITVEVADNEDFSTRLSTVATFSGWGGLTAKMIAATLRTGQAGYKRYQDVRYVRLKIATTDGGGFTTVGGKMPQIGELWLTRRWQLGHKPREPFDDEPVQSLTSDFVSPYGAVGRDVRFKGRQSITARFRPTTSAGSTTGIDEITALRSWFRDADNGVRPFLWGDEPSGGPGGAPLDRGHFMYLPDPSLAALAVGSLLAREAEFQFVELPPFQSGEIE